MELYFPQDTFITRNLVERIEEEQRVKVTWQNHGYLLQFNRLKLDRSWLSDANPLVDEQSEEESFGFSWKDIPNMIRPSDVAVVEYSENRIVITKRILPGDSEDVQPTLMYFPKDLSKNLEEIAKKHGVSEGELIVEILKDFCNAANDDE